MKWNNPFVVYRVAADKSVTQVFETADLQKAKYWIKYIAEVGDVLCRTPVSPKHSKKNEQPEYWCHKISSGSSVSDENAWHDKIKETWPDFNFTECNFAVD